jgi:transposase
MYVGMDVSKATLDIGWFTVQGKAHHRQVSNTQAGFSQLLAILSPQDQVVMEASGPYYLRVAFFLYQQGMKVSVVNPLVIRRFCQMRLARTKTDKKDALLIAQYGQLMQPKLWQPEAPQVLQINQRQTVLEGLIKQKRALENQLESLNQVPVQDKIARQTLRRMIRALDREIEKLEQHIEGLAQQYYTESVQALTSIPGIGSKTAILLISLTNNFEKFTKAKQLVAYVGLCPRIYQSGSSVKGKGHICKVGMARIRRLLYMCSWSAKRCNPACAQLYERLKARGKPERVIKIAIASKLLRQAFAIGKHQTVYQQNYALSA